MISRQFLCVGASLLCLGMALVLAQDVRDSRIPATRFSCRGRGSGYYADVETGCQPTGRSRLDTDSIPNAALSVADNYLRAKSFAGKRKETVFFSKLTGNLQFDM
ncbi:unnamed protein product [Plutella xylostella]|uniref:(diamondback moth) hypothetical protein n=1 Tax=Plutella xylostella TaxID=51655 RepID=A0A8S4G6V5_PLUXY|nr:unnamed protein product [Plutella xylostella]